MPDSDTPQTVSPAWSAPRASRPINATVSLPGSKSHTNRALVLAALANGPSVVRRPLRARDTDLMVQALVTLGVQITERDGDWVVTPAGFRGGVTVDVGLAGTVMRFVPPLATLADGPVRFDGDPAARVRPMGPLLEALRELGAQVDHTGTLPVTVLGQGRLPGGAVTLDASTSSQFVSGLLLSAPRFDKGADVRHVGVSLPSTPQIAFTVAMLRSRGVDIDDSVPHLWRVSAGPIQPSDVDIEPDLSNAAPFVAAALVTGGQVTIKGWPKQTFQAGDALRGLIVAMGGDLEFNEVGVTVRGNGRIRGIDVNLADCGELVPCIAALAALGDSPSQIRGVAHLRGHETDRLAALAKELSALGCGATETEDGLMIEPRPMHAGVFATYEDHRMAQAGSILGLTVPGIQVENIATTSKTMPNFVELWTDMLGADPE